MSHVLDERTPLGWRPVGPDDLVAVSELLRLVEDHDDPPERHSPDELARNMAASAASAAERTALGLAGEQPVALGWNLYSDVRPQLPQIFLAGAVHPSWRSLGIGRALLEWQLERARETGSGTVVTHADERDARRRSLYRRKGLLPVRRHLDLFRPLADTPAEPVPPAGIRLEPWRPELSDTVRRAHNEAFATVGHAREVGAVEWQAWQSRPSARPEWSWCAVEESSGEVVGYAVSSAEPGWWDASGYRQGWTDRLGVRTSWRGRGVASALLRASMRSFVEAGLQAAGLGVDTEQTSGVLQPYHDLGYQVSDSVLRHELDPAGRG